MTTDRKFPETRPETHSVINLDMVFNLSKVCWYYILGSHCVIIGSTPNTQTQNTQARNTQGPIIPKPKLPNVPRHPMTNKD